MMNVQVLNPFGFGEEELQMIEQMAASNFSAEQIAVYFDVDIETFLKLFNDSGSEIYRRYHKGTLETTFEINQKLVPLARAGNITAMQQFEKHKEAVKVSNLRKKYFG